MTHIQYIHGIKAAGEMAQRGAEVKSAPFIPYTALSRGEMRVTLAAERAEIYAQAYPELREYRQAAALLNNALYTGVHGGRVLAQMGAIYDPVLQSAAQIIARSISQTKPASTAFIGRPTLAQGIVIAGIGAFTEMDCTIYARDKSNAFYGKNESSGWYQSPLRKPMYRNRFKSYESECSIINAVQSVVNERIESSAHHLLYKSVLKDFKGLAGTRMDFKRNDHVGAIAGLANVAFVSESKLIDEWTENGILRYNALGGLGAMDSQKSGWGVATSADAATQAAYDAYRKAQGIGFEPLTTAAVVAVVGAITKALAEAKEFQRALNEKKATAAQVARNYGTPAMNAEEGDWPDGGENPDTGSGTGGYSDFILPLGLAAGAYLLLKD